jgi:hypothetical protein
VRRALRRSVFPVRFSVVILIQPEQAPGGFCLFLRLDSQSPQSDCFPSLIHSSKATPLFAVECQALVLIGMEPFPNSVLADFSVRSGEPMHRPGAHALGLGLHTRLPAHFIHCLLGLPICPANFLLRWLRVASVWSAPGSSLVMTSPPSLGPTLISRCCFCELGAGSIQSPMNPWSPVGAVKAEFSLFLARTSAVTSA